MAREHTMFIMAQDIPWDDGLYSGARPDVRSKVLSIDEAGTDASLVVEYPAGWQRSEPEYLTADEEILVLGGALEINGRTYTRHQYAFFPAGYVRRNARSIKGAQVLTMVGDAPKVVAGEPDTPCNAKKLIEFVDPLSMEWDETLVDPQLAKGVAIKPLRNDPETGESSFLYMSPPHRVPRNMLKPKWTHSVVEELFCLSGTYVWADSGRMGPGGYCWWRENVYHGPSGTDVGYHLFVRIVGGELDNIFDDEMLPFDWDPEFNTTVPDRLKPFAKPFIEPDLS